MNKERKADMESIRKAFLKVLKNKEIQELNGELYLKYHNGTKKVCFKYKNPLYNQRKSL